MMIQIRKASNGTQINNTAVSFTKHNIRFTCSDGLDDLIVGASYADPSGKPGAGKSYIVFGKADSSAIDLSVIANANNPTGESFAASPLITKPPKGLFASAITLRSMALLSALPNTT
jgi:hypothetical protein